MTVLSVWCGVEITIRSTCPDKVREFPDTFGQLQSKYEAKCFVDVVDDDDFE